MCAHGGVGDKGLKSTDHLRLKDTHILERFICENAANQVREQAHGAKKSIAHSHAKRGCANTCMHPLARRDKSALLDAFPQRAMQPRAEAALRKLLAAFLAFEDCVPCFRRYLRAYQVNIKGEVRMKTTRAIATAHERSPSPVNAQIRKLSIYCSHFI